MSEYEGREQSLVKHFILREYLERFAHIIASWSDAITYVDYFSGPWNVQSNDLRDSSFAIAVQELKRARNTWRDKGRDVSIRCFFLERERNAYAVLDEFARNLSDAEVRTKNAALHASVDDILQFVGDGGSKSFAFILIDPTGWTGFEFDVIAPLLRIDRCEVLVNFMTSFIRRFVHSADPATQHSFQRTFGPFLPTLSDLQGLSSLDLDDALVQAYSRLLSETGRFGYVANTIVLHPDIDSTHFHLIYATRNLKGLEVFKEAERKAMKIQIATRAAVRGKKREERDGPSLFSPETMDDPRHYAGLKARYSSRAKSKLVKLLSARAIIPYDLAWQAFMTEPLVEEKELKGLMSDWKATGAIRINGLKPGQRVPKIGQGITITNLKGVPS